MPRSPILRALVIVGLILLAVIILALALAVYQGRRTRSGTPEYVALGSSFAAGADLGPLQKASPVLCPRSVNG